MHRGDIVSFVCAERRPMANTQRPSFARADRPMPSYAWFVEHLKAISRQRITTIAKPIGFTPHRRKGEWFFRDRVGRELELREAFDALMSEPETRARLEWDCSYPIRAEEEWRNRQLEERRSSLGKIVESCRFLTEELGYSEPFALPATLDDAWIMAYRNPHAARQVEVSGRSDDTFHCEIRRLIDGAPGAYGAQSFGDWEIRAFREPEPDERGFVPSGDGALAQIVATLKRHTDLLTGDRWLERAQLDAAFEDGMRRRGLLPEPGEPMPDRHPSIEDVTKRVLTEELGFVITYDSTALTPHERQMWETFRFVRGESTVELQHTDIRVPDEWSLRVDGETVAQTLDDIRSVLMRMRESA
jgi:hypothetical protein